jgi:hypothetical protein
MPGGPKTLHRGTGIGECAARGTGRSRRGRAIRNIPRGQTKLARPTAMVGAVSERDVSGGAPVDVERLGIA